MVNPSGWLWIITLPQSESKSHNTFHRPATRRPASGGQTTATFLLVVKGTPSWTYLFQKNGTSLSVATGAIYTTPITTAEDPTFDVVGNNMVGMVTNKSARLTFNPRQSERTIFEEVQLRPRTTTATAHTIIRYEF